MAARLRGYCAYCRRLLSIRKDLKIRHHWKLPLIFGASFWPECPGSGTLPITGRPRDEAEYIQQQ